MMGLQEILFKLTSVRYNNKHIKIKKIKLIKGPKSFEFFCKIIARFQVALERNKMKKPKLCADNPR